MSYFFGIYGEPDNILSVFAHECDTSEEMELIARKPPSKSGLKIGTTIMIVKISKPAYDTLNRILDMVELNSTLTDKFNGGVSGLVCAITEGLTNEKSVEDKFNALYTMLNTFSKYDLGTHYTTGDLKKALVKAKRAKIKTHDAVEQETLSVLIKNFNHRVDVLNACPSSVVFWG